MEIVRNKILRINKLLIKFYGVPPRPEHPPDPVGMLIGTILSQNTNDKNSYKAFLSLKSAAISWDEIAKLSANKIKALIRIAGLGGQKSIAIKHILISLLTSYNKITLDHLYELDNSNIIKELTSYKGIGIKTANCVLLFSLRRNVCPVDTHVQRITNRIGIVKTATPDKTSFIINGSMPKGIAHQFHTNLIRLGREVCKPSNPKCPVCPVLKLCEFKEKNFNKTALSNPNNFMLLDSIK